MRIHVSIGRTAWEALGTAFQKEHTGACNGASCILFPDFVAIATGWAGVFEVGRLAHDED